MIHAVINAFLARMVSYLNTRKTHLISLISKLQRKTRYLYSSDHTQSNYIYLRNLLNRRYQDTKERERKKKMVYYSGCGN